MNGDLIAHGLGGQQDLPIPLGLAVAGAVAALVVSFTVLALAWRTPRYAGPVGLGRGTTTPNSAAVDGFPLPGWVRQVADSNILRVVARLFGLVVFAFVVVVAVFGQDTVINPFFGIIYVWLWVGIVPASLLFGPFWRAISPVRTLHAALARLSGADPADGLRPYPVAWGYWPAADGLLAFVWLELVYESSTELSPVRLWFAVYLAVMLVGGAVYGDAFFEHADPFEVYSTLVGRLSVWGRRDGVLVARSPLANLSATPPKPGLVGVVGVLFGSTGFDSFGGSPTWVGFLQGTTLNGYVLQNLALLVFCGGATGLFALACVLTGVTDKPDVRDEPAALGELGEPGEPPRPSEQTEPIEPEAEANGASPVSRRRLPGLLAPSLVPIIVGYVIAHYTNYFVEVGSRTVAQISDPFSTGANYFGTADNRDIVWFAYHPTFLASLKVAAIVVGHVLAAVVAHDRSLQVLPRRHQLTGQLPLLIAMVGFTAGGLLLLFSS